MENRKGMFVAGNPPLLWQLVGEREELELLQQTVPSEHPAQIQAGGGGCSRTVLGLKSRFSVCVCCRRAGNVGAGAFGMCEWAIPPPPVHGIVIPWAFHCCPREQRGQRMPQNAQNSVIWDGGVVSHLLQWKTGDSQTSLLFPEALGVEKSKALVVFQVGMLSPRGGSCIPQEELGEGQSCSWPGWSC